MSLDFLTRPIGKGASKSAPAAGEPQGPRSRGRTAPASSRSRSIVGGAPRVDLLPPEIRLKRAQLRTRRTLRLALFGVFVVVVAACVGTLAWSSLAAANLAAAQAQHTTLLSQQTAYSEATNVKGSIGLIKAGQIVGDSTEIDWQGYLVDVSKTLPAGMTIDTVDIQSATPMATYVQSVVPLQGSRVATLTFTVNMPTADSIPLWLDGLQTLTGFVDATPSDASLVDGHYTATVLLHIDTDAFANRFSSPAPDASATPTPSASASASAAATTAPTAGATPTPTPTAGK